jgi:hypothetical protein
MGRPPPRCDSAAFASALAQTAADKQRTLVKSFSFFFLLCGLKIYVEQHSCVPSGYFDGGKGAAAAAVGAEQR